MKITNKMITEAENVIENINLELEKIGRNIYLIRENQPLSSHYRFHSYSRETYEGSHYSGQEGPNWGKGKLIFSICYFWSHGGGGEFIHVTFPQNWLEKDWVELETIRVAKEREFKEIEQKKKIEINKIRKEEEERATFERLKIKYGE